MYIGYRLLAISDWRWAIGYWLAEGCEKIERNRRKDNFLRFFLHRCVFLAKYLHVSQKSSTFAPEIIVKSGKVLKMTQKCT